MSKKYQYALVKTGNLPDFDKISGGLQHVFPNHIAKRVQEYKITVAVTLD